jgi:hypothetical protein
MSRFTYTSNKQVINVDPKYKHLADDLLPKHTIKAEFHGPEPIANAIRGIIMDDIPVMRMDLNISSPGNIITDDKRILFEDLYGTLRQIVLNQEAIDDPSMTLSLVAHNKGITDEYVTTSQITLNGRNMAGILVSGHVVITSLEPGRYLKIRNIKLVMDTGRNNGCHQVCPLPAYKCNLTPDQSSLTHMPSKFNYIIDAIGDFSPDVLIERCMEVLREKIKYTREVLLERIGEMDSSEVVNLEVLGETYIMGRLSTYYILMEDPEIPFVADNVYEDSFILKIRKKGNISALIKKAFDRMERDVRGLAAPHAS